MNVSLVLESTDCEDGSNMPSIGETFRITATITDLSGDAVVAGVNTITLYDPTETSSQVEAAPVHEGAGVWHQDFTTLATDPHGGWMVVWQIVAGGITGIGKIKVFIDDPPIQG